MKNVTVISAEKVVQQETPMWRVVQEIEEDGQKTKHLFVFPEHTLEWRAAEYDIDHTDKDTLLDIVLHEPHLDDGVTLDHPRSLLRAASRTSARDFHLQRIQDLKSKVSIKEAEPQKGARAAKSTSVFQHIKDNTEISPSVVKMKRRYVEDRRAKANTTTPLDELSREERVQRALFRAKD